MGNDLVVENLRNMSTQTDDTSVRDLLVSLSAFVNHTGETLWGMEKFIQVMGTREGMNADQLHETREITRKAVAWS